MYGRNLQLESRREALAGVQCAESVGSAQVGCGTQRPRLAAQDD